LTFKPDDNGGKVVANVLKNHNIKHIFTLIGGHISPILSESKKMGIRIIDVRNEATAVFAADSVSRLSDNIGVAIVTAGPGVTNTITPIKNAQMAESPLLLISGASATLLKGRGALQEINQIKLMKSVCKKVYSCSRVSEISENITNAIHCARSGVPGPVFIEIPIDLLYTYDVVKKNAGIKKSSNIITRLVNQYILYRINYNFSGDWNRHQTPKELEYDDYIKPTTITKITKLVASCNKPIIVAGSQCVSNFQNVEKVSNILKTMNIPIYLSGMSRGLLGKDFKNQYRFKRGKALREADLIILLGVTCDFRLDYGRCLNRKANIISVNLNKKSLYLNQPLFYKATISLTISPDLFLLHKDITNLKFTVDNDEKREWNSFLSKKELEFHNHITTLCGKTEEDRTNSLRLCSYLDKVVDDKTIIIVDGGDFAATASYMIQPRGPLKWLDPGAFGTLGVGAGFALGAQLCYPDHKVIIIYGDGSLGYSIIEYDTFSRHNLNIISLVGNDACWTQILREQINILQDDVACNLRYTSYEKIVDNLDGEGLLIKNNEDIKKLDYINEPHNRPVMFNAIIGKTSFRDGSLSV